MSRKPERVFVCADVLIGSTCPNFSCHDAAVARLEELSRAGTELWISRQVLRDYLAGVPLPAGELIADVRLFERTFYVAEDGPGVTSFLLNVCHTLSVPPARMPEANVVATMLAWNIPIVLTQSPAKFETFGKYVTVMSLSESPPPANREV